jgi:hypothetical protein
MKLLLCSVTSGCRLGHTSINLNILQPVDVLIGQPESVKRLDWQQSASLRIPLYPANSLPCPCTPASILNHHHMGDLNQLDWIRRHRELVHGPILEIGSRHYAKESANDFRRLFPEKEFIGADMSAGENVDVVVDFTAPSPVIAEALKGRRFRTIICLSVLEHVRDIFSFSRNLSDNVEPGGILFLSVPFAWRFHGYPSDYWRFSPEAVTYLFPSFDFTPANGMISTNVVGDCRPLTGNPNDLMVKPIRPWWRIFLGSYHYLLAPTMISLLGVRR